MPVGWSAARRDFNGADPQAIAVAALLGVDDPAREPSQSLLDVPAGNRAEIEDHGRTRRSDVLLHDELAAAREGLPGNAPRRIAVLAQQRFGAPATAPLRAWLLRLEAQRYARTDGAQARRALAQLRREFRQLSWSFT